MGQRKVIVEEMTPDEICRARYGMDKRALLLVLGRERSSIWRERNRVIRDEAPRPDRWWHESVKKERA